MYIATNEGGLYLVDAFGNVAVGVWFSDIEDGIAYCERNEIDVLNA